MLDPQKKKEIIDFFKNTTFPCEKDPLKTDGYLCFEGQCPLFVSYIKNIKDCGEKTSTERKVCLELINIIRKNKT